ncbi:hypothetical protein ACPYO6_13775 [Georgenia sp. Z1344]|uniref:hypothetical protein n=1 Tax=Georgenia sp. Z1344 TaxID=3416706 RepID=UPI003CF8B1B4
MLSRIRDGARRLASAVDSRILPATSAARPALNRVATGAYTAYYLGRRIKMFRRIHRTDPGLFQPVGPVKVLKRPLPAPVADALMYATIASDVAFTLGVKHKVTGPLHAALLTWSLSYRNSWSMIFHSDNNLVLHTIVLGATPSADAVSVDALLARRSASVVPSPSVRALPARVIPARVLPERMVPARPRPAVSTAPAPSWRYAAPVRGMQAVTAVNYFLAGYAKVTGPLGWRWADGEVLRRQIAADGLRKELLGSEAAGLGIRLYDQTFLFKVSAAGSLVLELAAPLALLDRRLARLWAVSAFSMHWGIKAIMGITFRHNLSGVLYLPYFPLEKLLPARMR